MRIGALFAGYGGLDMAVTSVLGGELAWLAEIERGALTILRHRFPGVPNIGDVTRTDWASLEPVDVLTGGSPCQDLSAAGKRRGMTEGTRSNLWVAMREAIAILRPSLVIWENVRGAYSTEAASDLEPCPGCVGDGSARPVLRALGRVLGDLSSLGYDARWTGIRAADVGAPHERLRLFLVAYPRGAEPARLDRAALTRPLPGLLPTPTIHHENRVNKGGNPALLGAIDGIDELSAARLGIAPTPALPTPLVADAHTLHDTRLARDRAVAGLMNVLNEIPLLPTPAVNDMGDNKTVDWWDDFTEETERRLHNGNGHGPSLAIEMRRLPTPKATNNENAPGPDPAYHGGLGWQMKQRAVSEQSWGPYAAAVARWEALTRPVPAPTIWNEEKARADLSPYFVEWMMGVPEGWVTDPEIWDDYRDARGRLGSAQYVRKAQLHALGNGVCPPQAAAALRGLLGLEVEPWRDGLRVVA